MEIITRGAQFLVSEKLKGVIHGFSLRQGGVSGGDYESLNVGLRRGDNPFDVIKNIEICCDGLQLEKKNLTMTYQTHTANVRFVTREEAGAGFIRPWDGGVDGIVTDAENMPLMCYSADCVPTLLYEPVRRLIGAVHGGWRGTSEGIVKNAVNVMTEHGGRTENIVAFIGPAIGMCCYEVSADVADCFKDKFPHCVRPAAEGKFMLDLKAVTKTQLEHSGLLSENIDMAPYCTCCDNDMFFSHRRQKGKSGLLGGFIQMI